MSAADESPDHRPPDQSPPEDPTTPGMSHPAARRRGRLLIPGLILLAIVVVFLFIILVANFA